MMGNQRRGRTFEQDDDVTKKVCLEAAELYRKFNPTTFLDWVVSMENYFDWCVVPENRKVCFVKAKLKGAACLWCHNIKNRLHRMGQPLIDMWDEMKLKMNEHFFQLTMNNSCTQNCFLLNKVPSLLKIYKRIP